MKEIEIVVTEKMQKEMNELRKELGLPEEEIKPEYKLKALFG